MKKDLWFKLELIHREIGNLYPQLNKKAQQQLKEDFCVDCGTDLADLLFDHSGLADFYNAR